ncbi:hypothetical protein GCK72_013697 [Caenorhabditis remanei]|nr:hypothetical protein GCK72_013697 [Caenorhabditis remanei]KAF1757242.1 hypothetical protein GCK72_013697 [Caenorhabditis remanei]
MWNQRIYDYKFKPRKSYKKPVLAFPTPSLYAFASRKKVVPVDENVKWKFINDWVMSTEYSTGCPSTWICRPDEIQLLYNDPADYQDDQRNREIEQIFTDSFEYFEEELPDYDENMEEDDSWITQEIPRWATNSEPCVAQEIPSLLTEPEPMPREFMSTDRKLAIMHLQAKNDKPILPPNIEPVQHIRSEPGLHANGDSFFISQTDVQNKAVDMEYDINNSNDIEEFISESEVLHYSKMVISFYPVICEGPDNNDPYCLDKRNDDDDW